MQTPFTLATGRRKTSVARVRLRKGSGKIFVNDRAYEKYFDNEIQRSEVLVPLEVTRTRGKYDVLAKLQGGGKHGQAGALVLGISRALLKLEPAAEALLRDAGLLTRDPRMKERKKYGHRGARRRFQFSKR
jgi:small subunit ribosomal protein S9